MAVMRHTSLRTGTEELRLDRVLIVYPGKKLYRLDQRTEVVSMLDIASLA